MLDEADSFFREKSRRDEILKFYKILQDLKQRVQIVFFSATYEEDVADEISKILDEAYQISLQIEAVKLDNVQ